jgi:NADPH:quinone reductase-like Zn-dependent oxidoreductase
MIADGQLRPRISEVFSLDQIVEAYDLLASRRAMGKIVITMNSKR